MRFDSYFAGYNEYPYLSLYSGMVVFFADTGIKPHWALQVCAKITTIARKSYV